VPIARLEYGPSLWDDAGPWLRRLSPRIRWAAVAVVVLVAVAIAAFLISRRDPLHQTIVRGPLTFNTRYDSRIEKLAPQAGELLRLGNRPAPGRAPEFLVFRDGGPAPTQAEPAGGPVAQLALRMESIMRPLRDSLAKDDFQLRSQGRVKIGRDYAGWLVRYQFHRDGHTWFGVRVLLLPDVPGVKGRVLDMSLQSQLSPVVSQIAQAGSNGPMRTPFYGVAFGTEKP
jgi:hypothetical protein